MEPEIISDGFTVWVNAPTGENIARFGKMGVDVHNTIEARTNGAPECLACTHGPVGPDEWKLFCEAMMTHYNVTIPEEFKPK